MSKAAWFPWHTVVQLRDDLRTSELSLGQLSGSSLWVLARGCADAMASHPRVFGTANQNRTSETLYEWLTTVLLRDRRVPQRHRKPDS